MIYAIMGIFACKGFCYLRERKRERGRERERSIARIIKDFPYSKYIERLNISFVF